MEFHLPLKDSRLAVLSAVPGVSPGISHPTDKSAYELFMPSNSEQRSPHTYYRGCWHVFSRGLFIRYRQFEYFSSLIKGVYNPKTVILHAELLRQTFVHCARFPTAASRRSLGRVSVPMWPITLSGRLTIIALVGHYPTN